MRLGLIVPFILISQIVFGSIHQKEAKFIVEIKVDDVADRTKVAELIHIDSISNERIFAVVNMHDYENLYKNKSIKIISAELLNGRESFDDYYQPFIGELDFPDEDEAFHNYDEMLSVLEKLKDEHQAIAEIFSIGKSVENRDIWALRISDDTEPNDEKKAIVYMATHHAREHVSTEIPILFAQRLLELSIIDNDIKELLKQIEIFVIPMINPDGAMYDIEGRSYKWWRKNRRRNSNGSFGVDLNRNYGYGWGTGGSSSNPDSDIYMGRSPFSEPETQAVRDFFIAHPNITIALSLHTFSELVLYPWGGKYQGVGGDDEEIFKKIAGKIATMNGYSPMQSSDLYIASGDTCDWLYGELSVFCFTFELSPSSMFGGGFYPGASIIERVFDDNFEPMMYLADLTKNPRFILHE
jgi:carboxypeptidase T